MIEKEIEDKTYLFVAEPHIEYIEYDLERNVVAAENITFGRIVDHRYAKYEFGPPPNPNKTDKKVLAIIDINGDLYWTLTDNNLQLLTLMESNSTIKYAKNLCLIQSCFAYDSDIQENDVWASRLAIADVLS